MYSEFFILFLLTISTLALYKLSVENPGYITMYEQRNNYQFNKIISNMDKRKLMLFGKKTSVRVYKNKREILVDGEYFEEFFCNDCSIYTNNFVTHCYYCQCCVMNRDHHCIWLDTCITRYNMKKFLWLLNSTTIIIFYNLRKSHFFYIQNVYFYSVSCVFAVMLMLTMYFWLLFVGNIKSCEFIRRKKRFRFDIKRNLKMIFENDIQL